MIKDSCYIIAEAGLNHNGSMDIAKQLIDVAAVAKVDAVKFQKRNVATLTTVELLDAKDERFPGLGKTYREIRETLEFSKEEYQELKAYSENKGLGFICTAFDNESVDFLEGIGLETYKLASHSLTNLPLLKYLGGKKKKVILSTGMCTFEEIDQAVKILKNGCSELILLHCVSSYPQPVEDSNLKIIQALKERYGVAVGYSGHEIGFLPTLAAVCLGAEAVERHYTLDKTMEGFDHKISLEPQELINMTRDIRNIGTTFGSGEKVVSETEMITRRKYHVSMISRQLISKGQVITEDMITYKNPGTGIQPKDAHTILGKVAKTNILEDSLLQHEMVK
jgi:sialic acid synthase SpsE